MTHPHLQFTQGFFESSGGPELDKGCLKSVYFSRTDSFSDASSYRSILIKFILVRCFLWNDFTEAALVVNPLERKYAS